MGRYILDSGILVGYLRGSPFAEYVEKQYAPFNNPNISAISVITVGELYSLAIQFRWGEEKKKILYDLLRKIPRVDIHNEEIIVKYSEIDSYSKSKNPLKPLKMSARNTGDNDVWIAATAAALNATLITIDKDFEYINGVFLPVIYIDQSLKL